MKRLVAIVFTGRDALEAGVVTYSILATIMLPLSTSTTPSLPSFFRSDATFNDPPWQHDLASTVWHSWRGTLPGRWDKRSDSPPPPPTASPPPWWAVGVGGDGEYDWNKREREFEASGMLHSALEVRKSVASIAYDAAVLFERETGALHLLDCATDICRAHGISPTAKWRDQVREPLKLGLGRAEGDDPVVDSTTVPDFFSPGEAADAYGFTRRELARGTGDEDNPKGLSGVATERRRERQQMGLVFMSDREADGDQPLPWEEGMAECDDNDQLVADVLSSEQISSCTQLLREADRHGVACDTPLRPFGVRLNAIETACPRSCGRCRRSAAAVRSAGGGGGDDHAAAAAQAWHGVGEAARYYRDLGEYLQFMETAFVKLHVYCDGLNGGKTCESWQTRDERWAAVGGGGGDGGSSEPMGVPGADVAYDRFAHFFAGRSKQPPPLHSAAHDEFMAAGGDPPPPSPPPRVFATLRDDAAQGVTSLHVDSAVGVGRGDMLHVNVFDGGGGSGVNGEVGDGWKRDGGYRIGYGSEDIVVRRVSSSGQTVELETPTGFAHRRGEMVAATRPTRPRPGGPFWAMLRTRTSADRPAWSEDGDERSVARRTVLRLRSKGEAEVAEAAEAADEAEMKRAIARATEEGRALALASSSSSSSAGGGGGGGSTEGAAAASARARAAAVVLGAPPSMSSNRSGHTRTRTYLSNRSEFDALVLRAAQRRVRVKERAEMARPLEHKGKQRRWWAGDEAVGPGADAANASHGAGAASNTSATNASDSGGSDVHDVGGSTRFLVSDGDLESARELRELQAAPYAALKDVTCDMVKPFCASHPGYPCPPCGGDARDDSERRNGMWRGPLPKELRVRELPPRSHELNLTLREAPSLT